VVSVAVEVFVRVARVVVMDVVREVVLVSEVVVCQTSTMGSVATPIGSGSPPGMTGTTMMRSGPSSSGSVTVTSWEYKAEWQVEHAPFASRLSSAVLLLITAKASSSLRRFKLPA
jgi:hypothetical protein